MNNLLTNQIQEVLSGSTRCAGLPCEGPLRVAAATLASAEADEISATTVVGVVGGDDLSTFRTLVADIAEEFDLDARVRAGVASFSVRFSRRVEAPAPVTDSHAGKSVFARLRLMA